jgi:hypothetical protein
LLQDELPPELLMAEPQQDARHRELRQEVPVKFPVVLSVLV